MYLNLPSSRAPGKNFCCYYLNYNSITLKPSTLSVLFWQNESILKKKKKKGNPKIQGFLRKQHASYLEQVTQAVSLSYKQTQINLCFWELLCLCPGCSLRGKV